MSKGIFTLLAVFFAAAAAWAQDRPTLYAQRDHGIPAIPYEVTYQQPNGQTIRVNLKGDGAAHWAITPDGYKLVKNQEGAFCYAVEDATKGMKASNIIASDISSRTSSEKTLLKSLNKSIAYNPTYIERKKASRSLLKAGEKPQKAFPTKGNRKLLCILVSYQDVKFQKTQAEFNDLFNKQGYNTNGATGSVRDYFYDNSFQQMNLTVDVVGPVTVSQSRASYGGNNADGDDIDPDEMVTEAVKLADQKGVDFSQYDNDKDGTIDGVYVIFAGNGEEAGADAEAIWSHAWQIRSIKLDGVWVSAYSCSPELYGTSKTSITTIGVICHEFSHVCGLPDYYDTDYGKSGGEAEDLGNYDIMAGGSWNNSGRTPPFTNSYSRYMLGWGDLREFNPQANNTITPHHNTSYAYKVSNKANEYYIFENRQKVKWDAAIPGHGMIVYHVVYNSSVWKRNEININPTMEYFELVDASKPGGKANSSASPFPGTSNITQITPTSTPAMVNRDRSSLKTSLTNIKEVGGNITTDVFVDGLTKTTLKLMNGAAPLPNVTVNLLGYTLTTDINGTVSVPLSTGNTTATFTFNSTNSFTYTFAMNQNGETIINFKKIVAVGKSRVGRIANVPLSLAEYAKLTVSSTKMSECFVPSLASNISYTAQLNSLQTLTGNLRSTTNTVDTLKLSYNVYGIYTTQGSKSIANIDLKTEELTFKTDDNGYFLLYIPLDKASTTINLATTDFITNPIRIDNQKGLTESYRINLVSNNGKPYNVAPNPIAVSAPIQIYSTKDIATAYIYNLNGSLLQTAMLYKGQNTVDRSMLNSGVYLVKIESSEGTFKTKIVIL